jgi:hypothetical protein
MPRSRPGKKERATKKQHDQEALNRLNERISKDRSDSRVSKQHPTEDRKFSKSEVDAIVQAAVTAAVQTTTSLLTGVKPKQEAQEPTKADSNSENSKPRPLAERIQFPKKTLADRIVFPKKQ